jgi:hypothetical protein
MPPSAWPIYPEYLAQSFKPAKSGKLTKASFNFPFSVPSNFYGKVYVLLKSALGGNRGDYLAISDPVDLSRFTGSNVPAWIDFTFPAPVSLVAGQTYYLEINGTFFAMSGNAGSLNRISWTLTDSYADGRAFQRNSGFWVQQVKSLAFQTTMDNVTDISTALSLAYGNGSEWLEMIGGNDVHVGLEIFSPAENSWRTDNDINTSFPDSDTLDRFSGSNGADLTANWTITNDASDVYGPASGYYDQDGWATVQVWGYGTWKPDLLTDQFSISFSRTLTAVTDANGAYAFPNLPDGNYALSFDKLAYNTGNAGGSLLPGQNVNVPMSLVPAPTATLNGAVKLTTGIPVPGALVTVTDSVATRSAVSDSLGNFQITGIVAGNYTITFGSSDLSTQTLTGSLTPGQIGIVNASLSPAPITVAISSPSSGSVISTDSVIVAGTALNADTITVTTTNNGVVSNFPANIANGAFSATIALATGQSRIDCTGSNKYSQSATESINITVYAAPVIGTVILSDGYLTGGVYSQTLATTGGLAPFTWSITSGSLPAGLTLNANTGVISGTPTTAGSSSFTVQSTDAKSAAATKVLTITVYLPVSISTMSLPDDFIGAAYNPSLAVSGGKAPYAWSIATGTLPAGLTLDGSAGTISGTPTVAGTSAFTLRVSDSNGTMATALLSINVTMVHSLGDVGNVAVMEVAGNYDANNPDGSHNDNPRQAIAKEYFKTHSDLDFLVMLSRFDYAMPETGVQGFYQPVKNDTRGINQPLFDNSASYGSAGRLQGTIDLGNMSALAAAPYGSKLDDTVSVLNHELMHRFGAYVRFKNPDGSLNGALIGKDAAHWSYLLDTRGSIMYGNGWQDNGNGSFTSTAARSVYSPLDLYLMGMISKEQVPPMLLIDNHAIDQTQLPQLGATVTGTAKTVTMDDIIAAEGARVPDSTTSQKQFNVGFVLLTRAGDSPGAAPAAIETLRSAWAGRFAESTQGAGGVANVPAIIFVSIDSPAEGATITGPDVTVSGAVINSTGAETGVVVNGVTATVTGNRFIVNHLPLQTGANSLTISAIDAGGLTASTTRTVTAADGNYIHITSNIASGVAPLNISLRIEGSFSVNNATVVVTGPVAISLIPGKEPTVFSSHLTIEGSYTATVSVFGPDGQMYSDNVTITVLSKTQVGSLLQAKWEGIKMKIAASDVEGAISFLPTSSQAYYRDIFTTLGDRLPLFSQDLPSIKLKSVYDSSARCLLLRQETVLGMQKTVGYQVYFIKENGIWKLRNF